MPSPLILSLHAAPELTRGLALLTGAEFAPVETRRFPDGEFYFRCEVEMRDRAVALLCTFDQPDLRILPVIFAAATCRELGASQVGLVAPYLGYMRQDRRFKPGEAVTSRIFAGVLSRAVDWLITVDPHLHRHPTLAALYYLPSRALASAPLLAQWVAREVGRPLIIGPDEESRQWVAEVAAHIGAPFCVQERENCGAGPAIPHLMVDLAKVLNCAPAELVSGVSSEPRSAASAKPE